jgi:hypothetical protein
LPSSRQAISGHAQLVAKKDTCTTWETKKCGYIMGAQAPGLKKTFKRASMDSMSPDLLTVIFFCWWHNSVSWKQIPAIKSQCEYLCCVLDVVWRKWRLRVAIACSRYTWKINNVAMIHSI